MAIVTNSRIVIQKIIRKHAQIHKLLIDNCYPLDAVGEYRRWLQDEYPDGGKFKNYLKGQRQIAPSMAQLAIERLSPKLMEG